MDKFYEHIIKREKTFTDKLTIFGILVFGAAAVFYLIPFLFHNYVGFIFNQSAVIMAAFEVATIYGLSRLITMLNIEYEYVYTEGDLDIDKIISRRSRKRVVSIDSKEFEVLAPYNSKNISEYNLKNAKLIDTSVYIDNPANYFALYTVAGVRTCVVFQPTESMLKAFCEYIPQKVIFNEEI